MRQPVYLFVLCLVLALCPAVATEQGLILHYSLDADARDASPVGNHGQVRDVAPTKDRFGRADHAMAFEGKPRVIDVPWRGPGSLGEEITISAWINYGPHTQDATDIGILELAHRKAYFTLSRDSVGNPGFTFYLLSRGKFCRSNARLEPDTWYHHAVVSDGESWHLYVNGEEVAACAKKKGIANDKMKSLEISGRDASADDLRVYSRALGAEEIKAIYHLERQAPAGLQMAATAPAPAPAAPKKTAPAPRAKKARAKFSMNRYDPEILSKELEGKTLVVDYEANPEILTTIIKEHWLHDAVFMHNRPQKIDEFETTAELEARREEFEAANPHQGRVNFELVLENVPITLGKFNADRRYFEESLSVIGHSTRWTELMEEIPPNENSFGSFRVLSDARTYQSHSINAFAGFRCGFRAASWQGRFELWVYPCIKEMNTGRALREAEQAGELRGRLRLRYGEHIAKKGSRQYPNPAFWSSTLELYRGNEVILPLGKGGVSAP